MVATATQLHQRLVDRLAANVLLDNPCLRAAFQAVPREHFLPGVAVERVYQDDAVTCHTRPDGTPLSSSSQPAIMATMLGQLDPQPGDHVLEIGTGSGYNAALLAHLVAPGGQVTSIEIDPDLAAAARANLTRAGVDGVAVRTGDGWLGAPEQAPFDRIEATVGVRDLAPAWTQQLTPAGVLVAPLALHAGVHVSVGFARHGRHLRSRSLECCGFLPLRGSHAGANTFAKVQPGLWASLEDATDAALTLLGELLATTPPGSRPPGCRRAGLRGWRWQRQARFSCCRLRARGGNSRRSAAGCWILPQVVWPWCSSRPLSSSASATQHRWRRCGGIWRPAGPWTCARWRSRRFRQSSLMRRRRRSTG